MNESNYLVPMVVQQTPNGERTSDIFSCLLKERVVFLSGPVTEESANLVVAQFLYLQSVDASSDINFYINSPGGLVTAGFGIYDTMNLLTCDVATTCFGQAASMGAFLLSAGAKGKRRALANARIMIHQPLGGSSGQCTDIQIQAEEIQRLKTNLSKLLAKHCGQKLDKVLRDCERDNYMSAEDAKAYGLIDHIESGRKK